MSARSFHSTTNDYQLTTIHYPSGNNTGYGPYANASLKWLYAPNSYVEAGLSHDRTLAKLHKNLARAALAEGHPEEAILHLETALPLYSFADPAGKAEATYWLAVAKGAAGRAKDACAALQEFEVLSPGPLSRWS